MIEGIGNGASLARTALEAALRAQREAAAGVESKVARSLGEAAPESFQDALAGSVREGLQAVDQELRAADRLPGEMLAGGVEDFHEVAARLKRAELTFKFALEVRNKLIEAYRETMRMGV